MMARRRKTTTKKTKMNKGAGKIAHKITYIDGIKFHSKMESKYYEYLKDLKAKGLVERFELQPTFVLQDKYMLIDGQAVYGDNPDFNKIKRQTKAPTIPAIKYIADFAVWFTDGTYKVIDTKGKSTADFEIKRKLFMAKYGIPLHVIIESNGEWIDFYEHRKAQNAKKKAKKKASEEEGDK